MTLIHLPETSSTNIWLREHACELPTDTLTVVRADHQTAGRGCGTNKWESEPGKNLLFSVLCHPEGVPAAQQFILSMANALALKDTIDSYAGSAKIKWPNDIYWHDFKICGTLIETTLSGHNVKDCIIGTGINVNQERFLSDAPNPVSLRQITGRDADCSEVLQTAMDNMERYLEMVRTGNWETIRAQYRCHLYRLQQTSPYRFADGRVEECMLVNVTDDGHMELLNARRELYRVAFKEVQFIV